MQHFDYSLNLVLQRYDFFYSFPLNSPLRYQNSHWRFLHCSAHRATDFLQKSFSWGGCRWCFFVFYSFHLPYFIFFITIHITIHIIITLSHTTKAAIIHKKQKVLTSAACSISAAPTLYHL